MAVFAVTDTPAACEVCEMACFAVTECVPACTECELFSGLHRDAAVSFLHSGGPLPCVTVSD